MLRQQLKRNSLAIISLFVAFSALGYNTWRNEQTEENRNIRAAGFEMLLHIGQLQRISYLAHYDKDLQQGNPRSGWVEVLVLRDLSMLMPAELQQQTQRLFDSWKENWQGLGEDESAVAAIDNAINDLRKEVLERIKKLE
ncbi:MAG: hypothetical protein IZT60_09545 [Gammaproteobacteria bacterium]|nr:hypothetical protein [Gammaproteobacteria bacterium]